MFGAGVNRWKPDGPRWWALLALIVAGETVFFLPFVLARVFRPTFLEVFGLTNFQLGTAFALYGVVAMLSYFPGGVLADLLSPRKLLALALVATSGGGLLLASIPSLSSLKLLYAYWGFTTVALFWAALMRATRVWGGLTRQGAAFGCWMAAGVCSPRQQPWCWSWSMPVSFPRRRALPPWNNGLPHSV
jgi:Sugar phosphate permease